MITARLASQGTVNGRRDHFRNVIVGFRRGYSCVSRMEIAAIQTRISTFGTRGWREYKQAGTPAALGHVRLEGTRRLSHETV